MKKYLLSLLAMFAMLFTACERVDILEENTNYYIFYTSTDGNIVTPSRTNAFGSNIVSNTYKKSKGIIFFDAPVTEIGSDAFNNCPSLTSVTIPDSVTEIGSNAFSDCSSLTAFYGKFASADNRCLIIDGVLNSFAPAGLTEYTIPNSVNSIGDMAFSRCNSLTSVTIPDSVTEIGSGAFYNCSSLTSVTIPDSVTEIGIAAFKNCPSLTNITIPNSVNLIQRITFSGCSSLKSLTIPDSVTEIREEAFDDCSSLTSATIPNSVTRIRYGAFKKCTSLKSVYCKPTTPPLLEYDVFYDNASDRKIYVPTASVEAYKNAFFGLGGDIEGYNF